MMDEIYDRTYQSGRAELNDGIDHLVDRVSRTVATAFRVLNRIEFDAPWRRRQGDAGCA